MLAGASLGHPALDELQLLGRVRCDQPAPDPIREPTLPPAPGPDEDPPGAPGRNEPAHRDPPAQPPVELDFRQKPQVVTKPFKLRLNLRLLSQTSFSLFHAKLNDKTWDTRRIRQSNQTACAKLRNEALAAIGYSAKARAVAD